jgi:hypothetical protein
MADACSVAQSTLLTPRCGVGLNELLERTPLVSDELDKGVGAIDRPLDQVNYFFKL